MARTPHETLDRIAGQIAALTDPDDGLAIADEIGRLLETEEDSGVCGMLCAFADRLSEIEREHSQFGVGA